jgi:hypothetical protein
VPNAGTPNPRTGGWTQPEKLRLGRNRPPGFNAARLVLRSPTSATGANWILDFDQRRTAAEGAVAVIKHYGLSSICLVGRPSCPGQNPMTYWLNAQRQAPVGPTAGEDAIPFNRNAISVVKIGQRCREGGGAENGGHANREPA